MLKTPVITPFNPINATIGNLIKFTYTGSNQVVKNNLVIETLLGVEVYNQTQSTFLFSHNLPLNTLVNGNSYRVKVRVADVSNTWSNFSDNVIFYTLASPVLDVISIDDQNKVYNQTVNFETSYTHPDSELLQSYNYNLYDGNQNLLTAYATQFSDGSTNLIQEIAGLNNNSNYYVEVLIATAKGQTATTGKVLFTPYYAVPKMASGLKVENAKEQGSVRIDISAKQITFKLYDSNDEEIPPENVDYVDGKIDMTRVDYEDLKVGASENFSAPSDFVLKLWIESVPVDTVFMKLYSNNGWLEVNYYGGRFHCFKKNYSNTIVSHFVSNDIIPLGQTVLMVRQINGLIDLIAENIT